MRDALRAPFDAARWRELLGEIFARVEFNAQPVAQPVPSDRIRSCREIGRVKLADQRGLVLLDIEIGANIDLLHNRVELRNLVARFIDQDRAHGVLAIIRSGEPEYRLTFVSRVSEFDAEAAAFVQRETATRRFTYVLGAGHECHTASHRLAALTARRATATLDDVIAAFNVEPVSKEFFARYKEHYQAFCAHLLESDAPSAIFRITLAGLDAKADDRALKPVRDFVKKLLGRLVFLHFLQNKGWLGCPAEELRVERTASPLVESSGPARSALPSDLSTLNSQLSTSWLGGDPAFLAHLFDSTPAAEKARFHSTRLVPLFFDTLNHPGRPGDLFIVTGTRVPYLNGGLFERDFDTVASLDFPAPLFAALLRFFGEYHFTIDENDPDDHEIGIDPEMLGHIFENLLEDNKDKGAYYTPKAVVQYMCQQSLIHALAGHFEKADAIAPLPGRVGVPPAGAGILPARTSRQPLTDAPSLPSPSVPVQDRSGGTPEPAGGTPTLPGTPRAEIERLIRFKEPIDPRDTKSWRARHAHTLEKILDGLKICDPAIGSGAFPIGLLQEIFWTKMTLDPGANRAQLKRAIIQNSIHGVDLDAGAVEIARLRFWLALIVDEEEPLPLPNLDYQIMQGNSLLESFEGIGLSHLTGPARVGLHLLGSALTEFGLAAAALV